MVERVAELVKETLGDVRGGVSKGVFRGKGSLGEWKKLVERLERPV